MELKHLRSFLVVAEELHFARAAARLGIEQSPLSRQIQDLEADLKVRLFNRTRRATTLTRPGERFVADARRILADVNNSVRSLRVYAVNGEPVRLGLAEAHAGPPFGRLLQLCRIAEPEVGIVLLEHTLAELMAMMLDGGLDAILGPKPAAMLDLASVPAWSERLSAVMPEADGGAAAVWLKSLADRPWIVPDTQAFPSVAEAIETLLTSRGLEPREFVTAATPAALTRLVATGAGIGLLPRSLTCPMDGVVVRPVRDADAISTTWLTILQNTCPLMKRFSALVEIAARERQPPPGEP